MNTITWLHSNYTEDGFVCSCRLMITSLCFDHNGLKRLIMENNGKAHALNLYQITSSWSFPLIQSHIDEIHSPRKSFLFFFWGLRYMVGLYLFVFPHSCKCISGDRAWPGGLTADWGWWMVPGHSEMCRHIWRWNSLSGRLLSFNHVKTQTRRVQQSQPSQPALGDRSQTADLLPLGGLRKNHLMQPSSFCRVEE